MHLAQAHGESAALGVAQGDDGRAEIRRARVDDVHGRGAERERVAEVQRRADAARQEARCGDGARKTRSAHRWRLVREKLERITLGANSYELNIF